MLEWALRYIRLGWAVFPLTGKKPLVEHGLSEASINEETVRAWWAKWPRANIGLVCGGAFFVLDIDVYKGGDETWDALRMRYGGERPDTLEQITGGGGRQIFFAAPDFAVKNSVEKLGPGLDVRGTGGYVVAPPSVHPETKRRYAWDGIKPPGEQEIAPAPAWLLKLIQDAERRPASSGAAELPAKLRKGQRNDRLFKLACALRGRGFEEAEMLASLTTLNVTRCEPQLEEKELRAIAESAARYKRGGLPNALHGGPAPGEEPVGIADIEKAVDDVVAQNNLMQAVNLAGDVAKLPAVAELLAKTKLRMHFGKEWRATEFDDAVRKARGEQKVVEMPMPRAPDANSPADPDDLLHYPLTDSGNGERIIALFGKDMRWCIEMRKWLIWDKKRWMIDEGQIIASQKAKQTARTLYLQATSSERISKWARTSESNAAIRSALERAATEPGVAVLAVHLDTHPFLLNCRNGVLDLRSGALMPHDRGYLITKLCDIEFKKDAECDRFNAFILWAMGQNPEAEPSARSIRLMAFVQKAFGYALTGDVTEKCVFVLWGHTGDNGKTTLLNAFSRVLGRDYCAQIDINTLMASRMLDSAMRADLAALRGARFVTTSEVESGSQLNEAKLKYLTGMGTVKTKRLYENPIEFEPTHKLFMDCNYRPKVRGTEDAIWQRLKAIPFEAQIDRLSEEFDPKLNEKLEAEAEGILAWAARGCVQWRINGLGSPPEIADANAEWRESDDPLRDFLDDCCELGGDRWVSSPELTRVYFWWCQENREMRPLGRVPFVERMKSKGFIYWRGRRDSGGVHQLRTWEGIGLRSGIDAEMTSQRGGRRKGMFGEE